MADVADAQSPEGAFPDVVPLLDLSRLDLSEGAPAWGDAGVIIPWTLYTVYGDTRIIERYYNAMVRWMDYIQAANPNMLRKQRLNSNFGDWLSPGGDDTPKDLLATAYWAYDAKLLAEMAAAISLHTDADKYRQIFQQVREAFQQEYVTSDGRIQGNTQTCYVLALHMDLLPSEQQAVAAKRLVEAIKSKDWHLSTGFVGVGYLCQVLSDTGYTDVAYHLLNNDTFPSWGYTIKQGATTIWERWDGWTEQNGFQSPNMNSFNHYSLGSVGDWLYRYVAGISPDSAGYKHISIRPRPGGRLTWAKGEYNSVHGTILSDWKIEQNKFKLTITIPANTSATVYVPARTQADLRESGKTLEQAPGVEFLRMEEGAAVISVASGHYRFVSTL
jgi:alpha-L-rhamnosidase